jgi:Transposase IS116/IS110/IS902 family
MKRARKLDGTTQEKVLSLDLSSNEVRFVVTNYYDAQNMRKRSDMQLRHLGSKDDVGGLLRYWSDSQAAVEDFLKKALGKYAANDPVGAWMLAQHGIGPIIASGLLAYIDITKAPTAGSIWRYAGLDPSIKWEKGQKRPWNAQLKQICYHAGQCFKRSSNSENSFYGKLYREQKVKVINKNNAGEYAERAKTFVTRSEEVKKKLAEGKLPDSNLDSQATRFATKIFLNHLHAVMYWNTYHMPPPKPYAIAILGHAHEIIIPNVDMFPGLAEAYYGVPEITNEGKY